LRTSFMDDPYAPCIRLKCNSQNLQENVFSSVFSSVTYCHSHIQMHSESW